MSTLQTRIEKLEAQTDDEDALTFEFQDVVREWLSSDTADVAQRAQPLLERIRTANERKPSVYLSYLLRIGALVVDTH